MNWVLLLNTQICCIRFMKINSLEGVITLIKNKIGCEKMNPKIQKLTLIVYEVNHKFLLSKWQEDENIRNEENVIMDTVVLLQIQHGVIWLAKAAFWIYLICVLLVNVFVKSKLRVPQINFILKVVVFNLNWTKFSKEELKKPGTKFSN